VFASVGACGGPRAEGVPGQATLADGHDWTLPADLPVRAGTHGTYGFFDQRAQGAPVEVVVLDVPWSVIEPADGAFDFSRLDEALTAVAAEPGVRGAWIRLLASDEVHCPGWLTTKHPGLTTYPYFAEDPARSTYGDPITGASPGRFYPIWDPRFDGEIRDLIRELGARGYPADPRIVFVYAPHAYRWGEYEVQLLEVAAAQGVTPAAYLTWFEDHLDAWAAAFAGHEGKLVYTGQPLPDLADFDPAWQGTLGDLTTFRNHQTDHAIALGMGARTGSLEVWNSLTRAPSWGIDAEVDHYHRYVVVDDDHPLRGRIVGTENELTPCPASQGALCFRPEGRRAPSEGIAVLALQNVTLKTLAMRMSWINPSSFSYALDPALMAYAEQSLGRTVAESPDAWVALRQWRDPNDGHYPDLPAPAEPYRNWERWMVQREVEPGGRTIATEDLTAVALCVEGGEVEPAECADRVDEVEEHAALWWGKSWEAVRTDVMTGNRFIYFRLDDAFAPGQTATLKVTYRDVTRARWWVEYGRAGDPYARADTVEGTGDGAWRTATFELTAVELAHGQDGGNDLRIVVDGDEDVVVRMVRWIRGEQ
jgi:hypothetical protein